MKPKQILVLGIILGLLVVAVAAKEMKKPPELVTEEYLPLDLSFDDSKVQRIQIGKGSSFALVKSDDGEWRIPDFSNARADQKKIDDLLKEIKKTKGELRARDKSLFPDFEIDDKQAFRITLQDKGAATNLSLYIGNKLAGNNLIFLRREGSDQVYVTEANLLGFIGIYGKPSDEKPRADYWAATNLADFEIDRVEGLEVAHFNREKKVFKAHLLRTPELSDSAHKKWKYASEKASSVLDSEKVKRFLSSLRSWRATKVLDPKAKDYGLSNPFYEMRLGFEDGRAIVLTASPLDKQTQAHFIQVSSEPIVFQVPEYNFRQFDIDDSMFFADKPSSTDSHKAA